MPPVRMPNTTRRPRANLTDELDVQLHHLAVDLRRPVGDLLADATVLLLRWHGRGKGLAEPELPTDAAKGLAVPAADRGEAPRPQAGDSDDLLRAVGLTVGKP